MIDKEDLEPGYFYRGGGTKFSIALWDGEKFVGGVQSGIHTVVKSEHHYNDGLPHGSFKPKERIGPKLNPPYDGTTFATLTRLLNEVDQGAVLRH